ncbi:hypothetical protein [Caldalkalibacillus mannanilyticus]|uniref:hypothetical protein n=1 Tax=Caldalkalibacillus mannanilyticus TaxID=1418 RepID=UPI000468DF09|nr:hypothetical protein [Caldalkalibacillus mannanilyticus]
MTRKNFTIQASWQSDSERVEVKIKPPEEYEAVKLYRRLPTYGYREFADLGPVNSSTTYTRHFFVDVEGGEYEVQVRAFKKQKEATYDEDYGYVFCLPQLGSEIKTKPLRNTDIALYTSGKYIFDFYVGKKIGSLAKTVIKSIPDSIVGYVTAIADPLDKNHLRLTSWKEPQINDYFSYQLKELGIRTVGTVRWQDYISTTSLWRKNSNNVYQIINSYGECLSFPMFRDQDRYR